MLRSSPSPPFADCPLCFLARPLSVGGGVATCRRGEALVRMKTDDWSVVDSHPGAQTHLEHAYHVLAVPLLGDITEAGGDVDAAADVHVHLHGLLLDLTVQIRQVLMDRHTELFMDIQLNIVVYSERCPATCNHGDHCVISDLRC